MIEAAVSVDVFRLVLACVVVWLVLFLIGLAVWFRLEYKVVRRQWDHHDGKWHEID